MSDFAVAVVREEGRWTAAMLPERLVEDLDGLLTALRQLPSEAGAIGLLNVEDEFFVAARVLGTETRLLLSDVTAAAAWDLALAVVERLGIEPPGEDDLDDVWPAGDLSIFSDMGLDEMELGMLLSDVDAYADETLLAVARKCGFADAYESALEGAAR